LNSNSDKKYFEKNVIVPDTSALIEAVVVEGIESERYSSKEDRIKVIIPEAALAELEHRYNTNKITGKEGLSEIERLQKMRDEGKIDLSFEGGIPTSEDIRNAGKGAIDRLIRNTAILYDALFVTCDRVQADVGKARGLVVDYVSKQRKITNVEDLQVSRFFDEFTMSVHLKNNTKPMAKRGSVGEVRYVAIRDEPLNSQEMKTMKEELLEFVKFDSDSFIEIEKGGATVLQVQNMRILMNDPPFTDDFEITIARPIADVDFEKYNAGKELTERIVQQRGVLLAGAPGAGKSTLAAAIAKFLSEKNKVVKTMESPRDLQVPPEITQYGALMGKMENTAELLLLVRPDYTVYDEVRKTSDFSVFADMRLAGVGMIGVVHATRAIDAVQRLIGRIELGVIPQVVDTVIFVEKGQIKKVYDLEFKVKVPYGMVEEDLARPVVTISDFTTKQVEYEMYTFGEQVVVMPINPEKFDDSFGSYPTVSEEDIEDVIRDYVRGPAQIEVLSDKNAVVYVRPSDKRKIIGRGGATINLIERSLGIHIDVRDLAEYNPSKRKVRRVSKRSDYPPSYDDFDEENEIQNNIKEAYVIPIIEKTRKHVVLKVREMAGEEVDVFIDSEFIFSGNMSRTGEIKLRAESEEAIQIMRAARDGNLIYVKIAEF